MDDGTTRVDRSEPTATRYAVAHGIATAVAPPGGVTEPQAALLGAVTMALTGVEVGYRDLEPLEASEHAAVLERIARSTATASCTTWCSPSSSSSRSPQACARLVAYAEALGVDDDFVRNRASTPTAR